MESAPHSVLVAEDEGIVGLMLEEMLRDFGAGVVDVFAHAAQAVEAANARQYDLAILDVALLDGSAPVAGVLEARGVPFMFSSAMGPDAVEARHRSRVLLSKPFGEEELREHVLGLLASA